MNYTIDGDESQTAHVSHYYGNIVRNCYLLISFILLVSMTVDIGLLSAYLTAGVVSVVFLVILAGMTSPRNVKTLYAETVVSSIGFILFEYAALSASGTVGALTDPAFLTRQIIAVLFLVALYYSTKSVRGARRGYTQ